MADLSEMAYSTKVAERGERLDALQDKTGESFFVRLSWVGVFEFQGNVMLIVFLAAY